MYKLLISSFEKKPCSSSATGWFSKTLVSRGFERRYLSLLLIFTAVLFSFTGCELVQPEDSSPLVGKWKMSYQIDIAADNNSDTTFASNTFGNSYEFKDGGSMTTTAIFLGSPLTYGGSWSATADAVTITVSGGSPDKWEYKITGNELRMSKNDINGNIITKTIEVYNKQ